jgi:hypothetical protein
VLWLVLLGGLKGIVDQGEASGASSTENGAETEKEDAVGLGDLEQLSDLLLKLSLTHVGSARVDDLDNLNSGNEKRAKLENVFVLNFINSCELTN